MSDKTEPWTALQIAVYAINSPNTDKYADEVARLIEEYRQSSPVESKWVSVEKQLPKNNENVLCLTRTFRRMIENSWMGHTDQDAEWFIRQFSHWQPLPELPPIEEPKEK